MFDVLVVGGGPAGLSGAVNGTRRVEAMQQQELAP